MGCCKSRRRWLEPHIDYDPDFREHQKVHGTTYHCPSGHLMEELMTRKAGYLACDVCGRPQNVGKRMQGCWACDYHVCASCETKFQDPEWYASWRKFWSRPENPENPENPEVEQEEVAPVRPRCPGKHSLCQYFTGEEPPIQCDVCGKRLAPYIRIWGCSSCDYDIGPCCEQKFQDPQFLQEWQAFWKLPKEVEQTELEAKQVDVVVDPPTPSPTSAEGPSPVTPVVPVVPAEAEGPKAPITRPKPVLLNTAEELKRTQEDSTKAMVLGGQNHVVAHGLMNAVLKKDEKNESRASSRIPDPAVLKFAAKLKSPVKDLSSLSENSSKVSGDVGEEGEKGEKGDKKSKKKNKEDKENKEKSEKSEKKEKKLKKEGKESKETKEGRSNEGEETGQTDRRSRKVKKSRRETESPE